MTSIPCASQFTWNSAKALLASRVASTPEIFEHADGVCELFLDVGDPDVLHQEATLPVLANRNSRELKTWPSVAAARRALRSAGYTGGVAVYFWVC